MRTISNHPFINDLKRLHITTLGAIVLVLLVLASLQVTLSQTQKRQDLQQSAAEIDTAPYQIQSVGTYCRRDTDCATGYSCNTTTNMCVTSQTPTPTPPSGLNMYCRRNSDCPTNYACNTSNQCILVATPTPTATPTPAPAKRVFLTSTTYNGNLGGFAGADAKCQTRADAANLGGTWKAWLSDATVTAASRLSHNNGPYTLVNGTPIANNWNDLTDGTLLAPINITESGATNNAWGIWTDTQKDGTRMNYGSASCSSWTSASNSQYGHLGNATRTDSYWTWNSSDLCNNAYRLYCFEQ